MSLALSGECSLNKNVQEFYVIFAFYKNVNNCTNHLPNEKQYVAIKHSKWPGVNVSHILYDLA